MTGVVFELQHNLNKGNKPVRFLCYKQKAYKHIYPQNCLKIKHMISIIVSLIFDTNGEMSMVFSKLTEEKSDS